MISTQSNSTPVTTKPKNPTKAPACSVNAPSPSPPPAAGPPAPLLCADGLAEVVGVCVVCALEVVEPAEVSGDEPGPPEMSVGDSATGDAESVVVVVGSEDRKIWVVSVAPGVMNEVLVEPLPTALPAPGIVTEVTLSPDAIHVSTSLSTPA